MLLVLVHGGFEFMVEVHMAQEASVNIVKQRDVRSGRTHAEAMLFLGNCRKRLKQRCKAD